MPAAVVRAPSLLGQAVPQWRKEHQLDGSQAIQVPPAVVETANRTKKDHGEAATSHRHRAVCAHNPAPGHGVCLFHEINIGHAVFPSQEDPGGELQAREAPEGALEGTEHGADGEGHDGGKEDVPPSQHVGQDGHHSGARAAGADERQQQADLRLGDVQAGLQLPQAQRQEVVVEVAEEARGRDRGDDRPLALRHLRRPAAADEEAEDGP
mmetsp:Transcript_80915/g.237876  ORF Transcript_80915/g.237876 Transcript_80915/m.237876 type:complete len:210 (-) Transcript_80915:180-809(-)